MAAKYKYKRVKGVKMRIDKDGNIVPIKKIIGRPPVVRTPEEQEKYDKEKTEKLANKKPQKQKTIDIIYVDKFSQSKELIKVDTTIQRTKNQEPYNNLQIKKSKYTNPLELALLIDDYFEDGCMTKVARRSDAKTGEPKNISAPTMSGLALYLGFKSRRSLLDYEAKDEFRDIIQTAVLRIEATYEAKLHGTNPTGAIFALKNARERWSDNNKTAVDVTIHPFLKLMQSENE